MNYKSILKHSMEQISNFISTEENLLPYRKEHRFVRNRSLSLQQVCMYLLYSTRASMFQNISCIRDDLDSLEFPLVSKQALSKARQGILPELFQHLFLETVNTFYSKIKVQKNWHGYKLFAIDGTRIEIGNSNTNFEKYGKMFDPKNPSRLYSGALGSVLYDILEDVIVDASIHPFLHSERKAAINHIENFKSMNQNNAVVIMDRGYYSEEMYQYFVANNIYCLFRIKEGVTLAKSCTGDTLLATSGKPKLGLHPQKIRVVSVPLESGVTEYLATNIMDESITQTMFKELYFKRWKVECKYYEVKELLQMEEFNGTASTSIEQEFFITMMYSNLAAFVKADADHKIKTREASTKNKHQYQANRAFILGRIRKLLPRRILDCQPQDWLTILFDAAFRNRSQIQPNRRNKRHRRRPNARTHFSNRKTTT